MFCEIIKSFDASNFSLLFQVILGCLTLHLSGLLLGYITSKIIGSNYNEMTFLCGVMSSPHTTSLPLILIDILDPILSKLDNDTPHVPGAVVMDARTRGMLYIVLNSIFSNIWRWTISYALINPEEDSLKDHKEKLIDKENDKKEVPVQKKKMGAKEILKEIMNMPLVVSLTTILISLIPPMREAFVRPDAILRMTFLSVNLFIARGYNFLVMFMLGLNFANLIFDKNDSKALLESFPTWKIATVTIMKLLIHPLIGWPLILLFRSYYLFTDEVLVFLYMFMCAAPSAINIIIVCSIKNTRVELISLLMVVKYIVSIVTLTLSITTILYILLPPSSRSLNPVLDSPPVSAATPTA